MYFFVKIGHSKSKTDLLSEIAEKKSIFLAGVQNSSQFDLEG